MGDSAPQINKMADVEMTEEVAEPPKHDEGIAEPAPAKREVSTFNFVQKAQMQNQ